MSYSGIRVFNEHIHQVSEGIVSRCNANINDVTLHEQVLIHDLTLDLIGRRGIQCESGVVRHCPVRTDARDRRTGFDDHRLRFPLILAGVGRRVD